MEGVIAFLIFAALVPLLLTIVQVFSKMEIRRRLMIILNMLVWCYEFFFFIAVCGGLPHAMVHFGGGLGDLLFVFILAALILAHIITLSIMSYKTSRAVLFFIPLLVVLFPLAGMHETAARGNKSNGYMTAGNCTGLYYDATGENEKQQRQRELEEASKPKKPEFATQFELLLYDAEQGDSGAQSIVGCRYVTGDGVEKNDTLAVKWFRMSAENEWPQGMYNLGLCYYMGSGLAIDYVEAVKWFRKAAEQGYDNAQYMLGYCYGKGYGVEPDDEMAYEWLRLAARKEHRKAQKLLEANGQRW